jgi:saccharopine dehydrogenase-like NADP-dependent oxidoreductase
VTFRQSFPSDRFIAATRLLAALEPRARVIDLLRLFPPPAFAGAPERHEVLRALVRGERGGRRVEVVADCAAGPRAGSGIGPDIDTGAPPSIAALMLVRGEIDAGPGIHTPEAALPARRFLRELERRGMTVRVRARTAARSTGAASPRASAP